MNPEELSSLFPGFSLPYGSLMQKGVPDAGIELRIQDPAGWLRRWALCAFQQSPEAIPT
jgi:hypothetical protein